MTSRRTTTTAVEQSITTKPSYAKFAVSPPGGIHISSNNKRSSLFSDDDNDDRLKTTTKSSSLTTKRKRINNSTSLFDGDDDDDDDDDDDEFAFNDILEDKSKRQKNKRQKKSNDEQLDEFDFDAKEEALLRKRALARTTARTKLFQSTLEKLKNKKTTTISKEPATATTTTTTTTRATVSCKNPHSKTVSLSTTTPSSAANNNNSKSSSTVLPHSPFSPSITTTFHSPPSTASSSSSEKTGKGGKVVRSKQLQKPFKPPRKLLSSVSPSTSDSRAPSTTKIQMSLEEIYESEQWILDDKNDEYMDIFSYNDDDDEDDNNDNDDEQEEEPATIITNNKATRKSNNNSKKNNSTATTKAKSDVDNNKKKNRKKNGSTTPTTSLSKSQLCSMGKDQLKRDEIYDLLDGLKKDSDLDTKCDCASSLANMCNATNDRSMINNHNNNPSGDTSTMDFGVFLRAHNMIESVLKSLAQCFHQHSSVFHNNNNADEKSTGSKGTGEKNNKTQKQTRKQKQEEEHEKRLLCILIAQIVSALLLDPLNVDYIDLECFQVIHDTIRMHPVLKRLNSSSSTGADDTKRTRRLRAAALSVTSYKESSQTHDDQTGTDLSNDSVRTFERNCISRALDAMSTIVIRQQNLMEQELLLAASGAASTQKTKLKSSGDNEALSNEIEKAKEEVLFFHKTSAISTIEKLVPSLLVQLERLTLNMNSKTTTTATAQNALVIERDQLVNDMCKCIKMLDRSGLYKKYTSTSNSGDRSSSQDVWNMLIPAMIRCLQCLYSFSLNHFTVQSSSNNKDAIPQKNSTSDISSIIQCNITVLTFLTNITNKNEDACNRIALENGLPIIVQTLVLASSCLSQMNQLQHHHYSHHNWYFDIVMLCCGLLSNMTEESWNNRELLRSLKLSGIGNTTMTGAGVHISTSFENKRFMLFIVELFVTFYQRVHHSNGNDSQSSTTAAIDTVEISSIHDLGNNNNNNNNKASSSGKQSNYQMEDLVIASYVAIVLGCVIREHNKNEQMVRKGLLRFKHLLDLESMEDRGVEQPNTVVGEQHTTVYDPLIRTLHQFIIFQSNAKMLMHETYVGIQTIIDELRQLSSTSDDILLGSASLSLSMESETQL